MKYLLLILVVLVVWWLLRPRRRIDASRSPPRRDAAAERMVVCAYCGVHLPAGEALPGRGGVYCGEAHRAAHEASNPR
jgi:uncharacterized protein